ncbi:membrane hypothetical protein [Verrucomicrobia bacterium]|nr:membrane hypothetical protein [Verrucomicrobiota bacterium]
MNDRYENDLATELDQELKSLPDLPAPATLATRVMKAVQARQARPWYRQAWDQWPVACQAAALVLLLAVFAGLCYAGWKLPQAQGFAAVRHQFGVWGGAITSVVNILGVLLGAIVAGARKLGPAFLVAGLLAFALAYALCVGLGTACVRLAYVRRQPWR